MLQLRRLVTVILTLWLLGWSAGNLLRLSLQPQLKFGSPPVADGTLEKHLQQLQSRFPSLAKIDRQFLGEPLEETQGLLVTLALRSKDPGEFRLLLEILNGIRLKERSRLTLSAGEERALTLLEQRIQAVQAHGKLRRFPSELPAPQGWASDSERRRRQIAEATENRGLWVRISGGPLYWWNVRQELASANVPLL